MKTPIRVLIREEDLQVGNEVGTFVYVPKNAPNQADTANIGDWLNKGWFIVSATDRSVLLELPQNHKA
jgi:hypothetical protein